MWGWAVQCLKRYASDTPILMAVMLFENPISSPRNNQGAEEKVTLVIVITKHHLTPKKSMMSIVFIMDSIDLY